jgi:hypothetical protein
MNPQLVQTSLYPFFDDFDLPFIEANTIPVTLAEMEQNHIIPVFTKDNHALISQHEFIYTTHDILTSNNQNEVVGPFIRVSHPVKGRIPSARYKKASELLPQEETLYYERMMFVYVMPSITKVINGQELKLVIGGVKAYNQDNLNKNGNSLQQFTFFIGFQVTVCSNLCVWSDGFNSCIKVNTLDALGYSINSLITSYNPTPQLELLESLSNYSLTEREFAHFIGKCRMYNYLDKDKRNSLIPSGLTETQLSYVTKAFYHDESFSSYGGSIDFWNLYNLFTGALKTSYIDTIVNNNVQVCNFFRHLKYSLDSNISSWYLL